MDRNKINITRAKGMQDVGPELQLERQSVADQVIQCFRSYGYDPIDLPTIEPYELYSGIYGDYTRQQLFTLVGQREYSLRPDMTASVARMINHNLVQGKEENCRGMSRVYYSGKCFRFINPRRYRFREYWQVGGELFGSPEPLAEIELLSFISSLMVKLNIDNYYLLVGDVKLFRTILEKVSPLPYKDTLFRDLIRLGGIIHRLSRADEHYLKSLLQQLTKLRYSLSTMFNDVPKAELSEESYDLSPGDKQEIEALSQWALDLFKYKWNKIFSVSQEDCQLLGQLISIKGDWQEIKSMLLDLQKRYSLDICLDRLESISNLSVDLKIGSFVIAPAMSRGLDYYSGVVFDLHVPALGVDSDVCGGGRYDNLIPWPQPGDGYLPAAGLSFGIERLTEAVRACRGEVDISGPPRVIVNMGDQQHYWKMIKLADRLRQRSLNVELQIEPQTESKTIFKLPDREPDLIIHLLDSGEGKQLNISTGKGRQLAQVEEKEIYNYLDNYFANRG